MPEENHLPVGADPEIAGEGKPDVGNDTAGFASDEDHAFDTLADASEALEDDIKPTEGHAEPEDGDLPSEDDDETSTGEDLEAGDNALVALGDGERVNLGELKKGYFRAKDYTRKTEALARERKAVEALRDNYGQNAEVLQTAFQNLDGILESLIPPEPDLALAQSDPAAYQYQAAVRNNAIAELREVYAARQESGRAISDAGDAELSRYQQLEEAKLLERMPALKEPGRKAAFDADNRKTALEFGFGEQEIGTTVDHRILQLVHYARIGKIAEQNRRNAGRRVAERPRKGGRPNTVAGKPSQSREAMKRLAKTGSFEAAMMVDFD